ncbi:MAG: hypothetical protein ACREQA_08955 [Candidatus Binatia bacterium]
MRSDSLARMHTSEIHVSKLLVGKAATSVGYNGFGEPASDTATVSGTKQYQATCLRTTISYCGFASQVNATTD